MFTLKGYHCHSTTTGLLQFLACLISPLIGKSCWNCINSVPRIAVVNTGKVPFKRRQKLLIGLCPKSLYASYLNIHIWTGKDYGRPKKIAITAQSKIQSQSQIFRFGQSIFCLPHRPNFCRYLWFVPSLGVRSPWCNVCRFAKQKLSVVRSF